MRPWLIRAAQGSNGSMRQGLIPSGQLPARKANVVDDWLHDLPENSPPQFAHLRVLGFGRGTNSRADDEHAWRQHESLE